MLTSWTGVPESRRARGAQRVDEYAALSRRILRYANRGSARIEFLTEVSLILLEFSGCDGLEIELLDPDLHYCWQITGHPARSSRFTVLPLDADLKSHPGVSFTVDGETAGVLRLHAPRASCRPERLAEILALAIANRRAQWALRERVKELTCLYGIGRIAQEPDTPLDRKLREIVELLPPAWQFPEIASAAIVLDGRMFATAGFGEGHHCQTAEVAIAGAPRGRVEVAYTEERPEFAEGAFLKEERSLIDTVAREVGLIVQRREDEEYKVKLQAQLRHADRLATIGKLAAGVAHELNEPLGSVLGFAQLAQKDPGLPAGPAADLEKIIRASLHAREVIHKLLLFARQKVPAKVPVDLNRIVQEGLNFMEARCAKAGIAVSSTLAPVLPEIKADPSQLHQVLVNLMVNSIQAMPDGGELRIETGADSDAVWLKVGDTGCGMTEEVKDKIFSPFFTTKDVDQGTGLGLAVVHGIVTGHGGSIGVESAPGHGAQFEIRLPVNGKHV